MIQYKRRSHNNSVDVKHAAATLINDRKHSLDFKKYTQQNRKNPSYSPQQANISFIKQNREDKFEIYKRFRTEKVSVAGSDSSFRKRKLSFGKSTDLKTLSRGRTPSQQAQFNQAVELIGQGNYSQAIKILTKLIEEKGPMRGGSCLWLAICHRKVGKPMQAFQVLNVLLTQNPRHYEALICRCKILMRLNKFDEAFNDIESCIAIDCNKGLAYIMKGDCLRLKHQYRQALECYEKALGDSHSSHFTIEVKKLQLLMDTRQYQTLVEEVGILMKGYGPQSEFLTYKGLAQKQLGQLGIASLTFQQSLKYNNSKKGVSRSLYQLVKIKMEQRDFYAAYHTISRSEHLNVDPSVLKRFKTFNEAAVLMMKRKFEEGLSLMEEVKADSTDLFMNPLLRRFKAYALFCLGKHQEAVEYYQQLTDLDEGSQFNYLLCKGIIQVEHGKYSEGMKFFNSAKKVFPAKVEPYIYIGAAFIKKAHTLEDFRKDELIMQGLQQINQGNLVSDCNSNLLYHRAIIYYYLQDWESGLVDINRCIEKAEDNLPKYFYLRGLGYACTKDLVSAINEFSIGVSLNKKFPECYLQRAKCLFLLGDTEKAFNDLHTYVQMQPDDYYIHRWIGSLLYQSRSYTDAMKTFQEIQDSSEVLIMKAKCSVRLCMIEETKKYIGHLKKSQSKYSGVDVDQCALGLLQLLMTKHSPVKLNSAVKLLNQALAKEQKGEIFKLLDCMVLIGSTAFYLGKHSQAYSSFDLARQLYQGVSSDWKKPTVKSEVCQDHLDLDLHKLYFNIFLCLVGQQKIHEAVQLLQAEVLRGADAVQVAQLSRLMVSSKKNQKPVVNLVFSRKGQCQHSFETVELPFNTLTIKAKLMYGLFHDDQTNNLYPTEQSQALINKVTPTYIQNKPQAPWIKRNSYGVVFTDDLLSGQSIQLDSTQNPDSQRNATFQSPEASKSLHEQLCNFRRQIQLDQGIQLKLNKLLNKG